MKKYIKNNHLSIIIILISLFLMVKPDISSYLHKRDIEKQNQNNYINALKYYDEFSLIIRNHNLDKQFSDIKSKEMSDNLIFGCSFQSTNEVKDLKSQVYSSCVSIVNNIYIRLISFDSEIKRKEILQELDKLKNKVNSLIEN